MIQQTEEDQFYDKIRKNVKKLAFNAKVTLTIEKSKIEIENLKMLLNSLVKQKQLYIVCKMTMPNLIGVIFSKNPIEKGIENPSIIL
jgi:hypothetical protein